MRLQNMGFTLLIMVLFPFVTSGKMAFACWKLAKPLLQKILSAVLIIFREYESTHKNFIKNINQLDNEDKLSSQTTTRLSDTLNRSSEMPIINVFPNYMTEIKNLRFKNVNRVIIGDLNIHSLPNKFDQLREIVLKYIDVLVTTETKLDDTLLTSHFLVSGFSVLYK